MTTQKLDKFIEDGEVLSIYPPNLLDCPNASIQKRLAELQKHSTACRRGYIGTWAFKDGILSLIDFEGHIANHEKRGMDWLSPDHFRQGLKAEWITEILDIPVGKWVSSNYGEPVPEQSRAIYVESGAKIAEETRATSAEAEEAVRKSVRDQADLVANIRDTLRLAEVKALIEGFDAISKDILQWNVQAKNSLRNRIGTHGWVSREFARKIGDSKPSGDTACFKEPEIRAHLATLDSSIREAVINWMEDIWTSVSKINNWHLNRILKTDGHFFRKIEKSPLTEEQARAVACFDSRVLLVASAGSGKTSTMVAKVGYALMKGYFAPEQILVLAFNSKAALELGDRIQINLHKVGLTPDAVTVKTFHALGLDVIGRATGKRPSLAQWLEGDGDLRAVAGIVEDLKATSASFRDAWSLFRLVFDQDAPKDEFILTEEDRSSLLPFETLNGELVKSRGEVLIANWLFYNGVPYRYEAPYEIDTADKDHRQYSPDFFLPTVGVYIEHWALDEKGNPPPSFVGYREGMVWKKRLHKSNGTTLLETTSATLWSGTAFDYLSSELVRRGIILEPNPDRPVVGRKPIEDGRLARTLRSFLTHAKSNRLSLGQIHERFREREGNSFAARNRLFLAIFEGVWNSWEARLKSERVIDFEDMLNLADECIERGLWQSPYSLVMVDEFQDVSRARARILSGLVKGENRQLFAVGDDWQSINRFAGADIKILTDFEEIFGPAERLYLQTTFRCPQSLCDISSQFIQKNPLQLRKTVNSHVPNINEPINAIKLEHESEMGQCVMDVILDLDAFHRAQRYHQNREIVILILGRYNRDRRFLPRNNDALMVKVEFSTIHSAKGLEADHIIVPNFTSDTLGFPSKVSDDTVLQLVTQDGETFTFSEERRLFYVALTRAKLNVTLLTVKGKFSPFLVELIEDHLVDLRNPDGSIETNIRCPVCYKANLLKLNGKYGVYYGCARYPECRYTQNGTETNLTLMFNLRRSQKKRLLRSKE